jgi:type 1 glutamine amidotransferase
MKSIQYAACALLTMTVLPQAQTPIKVLFWGGTATGTHNSRALRDTLASVFTANNLEMHYREANSHSWLTADSLAAFDVALLYTTNQTGTDLSMTQLNAFVAWIASGRVAVAFHGSTNTYLNNGAVTTAWRQLLGAQFVDHDAPNHAGTPTFTQPNNPFLLGTTPLPAGATSDPGVNSATYWDEGRRHNQYVNDTVVIARSQLATTNVPWIWVRPQGLGWVYYNASGHRGSAWTRPEFKGQLVRALQWGASIKTTGIRGKAAVDALIRAEGNQLMVPGIGAHSVRIHDLTGRNVFSGNAGGANQYDLSGLPLGVYSIEVLTRADAFHGIFVRKP